MQGYLAHERAHTPRTLPQAYAKGPRGVLKGWAFSYERGTPVGEDFDHWLLDLLKRIRRCA